jgi:16S rRNA pseudouridine516 synthase
VNRLGDATIELTLTAGRYHQVKRMLGSLSHRVTALHRTQVGAFRLPDSLAPGCWLWLDGAEVLSAAPSDRGRDSRRR